MQINNIITLNSLIEASASIMTLPASPLPLLEVLPPRDARAAAESAGVAHREDGCRIREHQTPINNELKADSTTLTPVGYIYLKNTFEKM